MTSTDRLQFFTIVAQNYLAHALVLGDSVLQYHPDAEFSIFLIDDVTKRWQARIRERGFRVVYPDQIPLPDYRKFVFKYNITEASTGVKPFVFRWFFEGRNERVVYLDPDIRCFRRLSEVIQALDESSIVLTPHSCSPTVGDSGEAAFLSYGIFNLGFIALRKDDSALSFLNWWSGRLANSCVNEPESGLFVDQKWIDLAPVFFDRVQIIRQRTYNIAYWNLHERAIEERDSALFEVSSGQPVAFIHFSGFDPNDATSISRYKSRNPLEKTAGASRLTFAAHPYLKKPFQEYGRLLSMAGVVEFSQLPYAYATYENGERVSQLARSIYRSSPTWQHKESNPFAVGKGTFWAECWASGIRCRNVVQRKYSRLDLEQKYEGYMRLIRLGLRLLLWLVGPDKYLELSKYMRHRLLPSNQEFLLRRQLGTNENIDAQDTKRSTLWGKELLSPYASHGRQHNQ